MTALFANNAQTTLSAGITAAQTTLPLATGTGSEFPSPAGSQYFMVTLQNAGGTIEVCKCTGRSGDTLTVVRAQEGTTGFAFASGDKAEARCTAGNLTNFLASDNPGNTIGSATAAVDQFLYFNTATGQNRAVGIQTANQSRWTIGSDNSAESGSNAGSNFSLGRFTDAGALIDTVLTINRASGLVTLSQSMVVTGSITANGGKAVVDVSSAQTLTNKTLTAPQVASLTPDGTHTLTMPVATDTVVGKATTDTLTNKTISACNVASTIDDGSGSGPFRLGFRDVPTNPQNGAYTLTPTDAGKGVYSQNTGAQAILVDSHANQAIGVTAVIGVVNDGTANITLNPGTGVTLKLTGTSSTGARTVPPNCIAWLWQVSQDRWFVSGTGVS